MARFSDSGRRKVIEDLPMPPREPVVHRLEGHTKIKITKDAGGYPADWDLAAVVFIIGGVLVTACGLLGALILVAIGWVNVGGVMTATVVTAFGIVLLVFAIRMLKKLRE